MQVLFSVFLSVCLLASANEDMLTGRWESRPSEKGIVTGVVFKPDQTYEGYVNRKPFVSGRYTLQDSVFTMMEPGCNGFDGVYRIYLFHGGDSLRFIPLKDSCTERRGGMSRLVLGRVKK